jgi:hypothetical protein
MKGGLTPQAPTPETARTPLEKWPGLMPAAPSSGGQGQAPRRGDERARHRQTSPAVIFDGGCAETAPLPLPLHVESGVLPPMW